MEHNRRLSDANDLQTIAQAKNLAGNLRAAGWQQYGLKDWTPADHNATLCDIVQGQFLTRVLFRGEGRAGVVTYEIWWKRLPKNVRSPTLPPDPDEKQP